MPGSTFIVRVLAASCWLLALSSSPATAVVGDLLPEGATWRYLKGVEPPPPEWNAPAFDAGGWLEGPAGFGYGDGDDATVLEDMQGNYLTVYLRAEVLVADPALIETLVLRTRHDDGFVAYLNGIEVARGAMGPPGSPVAFDTPASSEREPSVFTGFDITARVPLLVAGTNVLSVEVHNWRDQDSDLSFDARLIANGGTPDRELPPGFVIETLAGGFQAPVQVAFAPDGTAFVAEKRGLIWAVKDGLVQATPVLDLREEVGNAGDRGLLGIELDPSFATNGHLYVLYVVDPTAGEPDEPAQEVTFGRLARYTVANGAADPATRTVLLGSSAADGFVHCHASHAIGTVAFGPDGALFAGSGDGAHFDLVDSGQDVSEFDPGCAATFGDSADIGALRAQDLDVLAGKIVRVDAATGQGLPDNPHFTGNAADARSKVWASGLRNPFRFTVRPSSRPTGTLYIGDVGWFLFEELNVAGGGENFGWPCYEGRRNDSDYTNLEPTASYCRSLSGTEITLPLLAWNLGTAAGFQGNCASGVAFCAGTRYPSRYRGALFFADYGRSWVRAAHIDGTDRLIDTEDFASGLGGPVDLKADPVTGDLVYVSIELGELRRFRYTAGNRPPSIAANAAPSAGRPPLEVRFSSAGTADPDLDPVTLEWDFGDGSEPSPEPSPIHVYEIAGIFPARLTARDDLGGESSLEITINTLNEPPRASILSPGEGSRFFGGETITLLADAHDYEDGENLAFEWEVILRHEDHEHREWFVSSEREPVFVPESHGDDGESFRFEVRLTVRDSGGLEAVASVDYVPGEILRGDGNADGVVDLSDPIGLLLHLFAGLEPRCPLALDADGDQALLVTDAVRLLMHLFQDGPAPAPPHPGCGVARNIAGLRCGSGCP